MSKRESLWKVLNKNKNTKQSQIQDKNGQESNQKQKSPSEKLSILQWKEKYSNTISQHPRESMNGFSGKFKGHCLVEKYQQINLQEQKNSSKVVCQYQILMSSLSMLEQLELKFRQEKNKILNMLAQQYQSIQNAKKQIISKLSQIQEVITITSAKLYEDQPKKEQIHKQVEKLQQVFAIDSKKTEKKNMGTLKSQIQLEQNLTQTQNPQILPTKTVLSSIQQGQQQPLDELPNPEEKKPQRFKLRKRGRLDLNQEQI